MHKIEDECHIVPESSYKLTPNQEIRPNEAFNGLELEDNCLSKFVHFTPIKSKDKKEQMERDDSIFRSDFLDSVSEDHIKGSWTIHTDVSGGISNI